MKKFSFLRFLVVYTISFVFLSCSREDVTLIDSIQQPLQLKANVGQSIGSAVISWDNSDAIGLYIKSSGTAGFSHLLDSNRRFNYSTADAMFKIVGNPIYLPASSAVDLIAYMPYTNYISNTSYPINIYNQSNLKAIDLLYSKNVTAINSQNSPVALNFEHQLSKIIFAFRNYDNTIDGVENVKIALKGFYGNANFDLSTGIISNQQVANLISVGTAREAIVIPNVNLADKIFSFTIAGSTFDYNLPTTDVFQAGKVYRYSITIQNQEIRVALSSVSSQTVQWDNVENNNYPIKW